MASVRLPTVEIETSSDQALRNVEGGLNIADPGLAMLFSRDTLTRASLAFRLLARE